MLLEIKESLLKYNTSGESTINAQRRSCIIIFILLPSQQTEIIHNGQTESHRGVFKEKDYLFYKTTPDKNK